MVSDGDIIKLEECLKEIRLTRPHNDHDGWFSDKDGRYSSEDSPAAEIARSWCDRLLIAANANGLHGCRLCQS